MAGISVEDRESGRGRLRSRTGGHAEGKSLIVQGNKHREELVKKRLGNPSGPVEIGNNRLGSAFCRWKWCSPGDKGVRPNGVIAYLS